MEQGIRKYIRKADIILFIILVAAGLAASAVLSLSGKSAGEKVVIKSGGEIFATYPLDRDVTLDVPAPGAASSGSTGDDSSSPEEASSDGDSGDRTQYESYNTVEIKGGRVSVTEASCRNHLCMKHRSISKAGESIVCLPNRLVVSIEGGDPEGGGYDAVTS